MHYAYDPYDMENQSNQETPLRQLIPMKLNLLKPGPDNQRDLVAWQNITVKDLTDMLALVYKVSARCEMDPSKINFLALEGAIGQLITSAQLYKERACYYRKHRKKDSKVITLQQSQH